MPKKPFARIALFTTALSLAACAHSAPPPSVAKEKATMIAGSQTVQPTLTAEQGLLRLLELIRTSQTVTDITPERVSAVMGIQYTHEHPKTFAFGERVTPQWEHVLITRKQVDAGNRDQIKFEYLFNEVPEGSSPDMTDVCQVDFDRFTAELEAMGFSRGSYYGSPPLELPGQVRRYGPHEYDIFWRPGFPDGLLIDVYPRGEANEPIEKISHNCVKHVFIF